MNREDKDVSPLNQIGDITNSTIENIVQTIKKSIEIPQDLKDLLIVCLLLFKENSEWQKEQRLKVQKESWFQEKDAFYRNRAHLWSSIIFLIGLILSVAVFINSYVYPLFQYFTSQNHGNPVIQINSFLEYLMTPRKEIVYVIAYFVFLMGFSFFVGGWIGKVCANKKFGKYFRLQ